MVDFSILKQTPDFYGNALNAFEAGRQTVGQRQASTALQSGDYGGAQNALFSAGMIDQGLQVQGQQRQYARQDQQDQRIARRDERDEQEYAAAQKADLAGKALNIAKSLRVRPMEQRGSLYEAEAIPILQQLEIPQDQIDRVLLDGHLTDDELDDFIVKLGGVLEAPEGPKYQVMPGPNGMVGYTAQQGSAPPTYTRLQEPVVDPLDVELKRARIGSANRGNRGGGGSGGGSTDEPWKAYR